MSNIEFETDKITTNRYTSRTVLGQPEVPGMASWLIKKGIIKEESQSGNVFIGIIIVNILIIAFLTYKFIL